MQHGKFGGVLSSVISKRVSSGGGGHSSTGRGAAGSASAAGIVGGAAAAAAFNVEAASSSSSASASCLPADLDRRLDRHLLPALCCLSIVNYIDRTNLAFAASGLERDVGISLGQYGLGSSLLFVTYGAAQLPIAALGSRIGVVRTLGVACFLWGVVAMSMAAINSVGSFYAARLALGLAEAPTFPLVITILRSFHATDGAVGASYAYVHASTLVASVVGGPLAAAILSIGSGKRLGLEGWRWLFVVEGAMPMLLSAWIFTLPSSPAKARFLTPQQRVALAQRVADARGGSVVVVSSPGGGSASASTATAATTTATVVPARPPSLSEIGTALWATLLNWKLWGISALELVGSSGRFGVQFFTPLIIERLLTKGGDAAGAAAAQKKTAGSVAASAALSAIPFGLAAVGAVVNAAVSKRVRHRKWFVVWPGIVCAAGLAVLGPLIAKSEESSSAGAGALSALVAGAMGFAGYGIVMSIPSTLVGSSRTESALGYALFTMVAMTGGLVGPSVLGALTQRAGGNYSVGAWVLGAMALASTAVYATCFHVLVPGG